MNPVKAFRDIYIILHNTIKEFGDDQGIKYGAALAYYTVFSLAPTLLIIISVLSFFFGQEAVQGEIYGQIKDLVGSDVALQVQSTIRNIHLSHENFVATITGIVILFLSATAIFGEIQDSINSIWGIMAKPKRGWIKLLINRLLSFSMVISIGFMLLVSLVINALVAIIGRNIGRYFPELSIYVISLFNNLFTFAAIVFLFAIIFKVLPDARIKWKDVIVGAIVTALLFMAGKFVIGYYLGQSNLRTVYGAAGSIIIIMVWVYYNAIILYFGAEFTQVYTQFRGRRIYPNAYAVLIEKKIVEIKPGSK